MSHPAPNPTPDVATAAALPQTLPPLFLAARALDRFRGSPTPDYPEVRRTLLAHAQRARTADQRLDHAKIIGLLLEARQLHQAREAALTRLMLAHKRDPDGSDTLTQWYAAMLGEADRPAKTPSEPPAQPHKKPKKAPTHASQTQMEKTLLALTQPAPAKTDGEAKRPLGQSRARAAHDLWQKPDRREEREARQYAERWYQALRNWRLNISAGDKVEKLTASASSVNMVAVAGNWASQPKYLDERRVLLPIGERNEQNLNALCNADPTLYAIREGGTLATLVDPRGGWSRHRDQALLYAHVMLCLAFYLGDPFAQGHLRNLPAAPKLHKSPT